MSNKKLYINLIDSIMEGNYSKSQKIVNSIVEGKIENRISRASKQFITKTQGK